MTRRTGCRLAVLASHPIQYFTPIYQRLAATTGIDLEVLFCREFGVRPAFDKQFGRAIAWDTDLLGGYNYRFLRNVSPINDTFNPLHAINPGAFTRLLDGFDVLWVNGYLYPSNWLAAAAAALCRTRIIVRSELRVDERQPHWYDWARNAVLRRWIGHADALLYIGEANREAYRSFGAADERMFFCPYSGDVERIHAASFADDDARKAALDVWGLPRDRTIVLFVGKLISGKQPDMMLDVAAATALADRVHVVVAGSGRLEAELRSTVERRGLHNVTLLGFVNQSRLPELYNLAEIFVMPSTREQWGVVLHEAMAAGCAAVVSNNAGAARDLIDEGQTGYTFAPLDRARMVEHVAALVQDPALRARIADAGRARSSLFSYDRAAAGVLDALSGLGLYERPQQMNTRAPEPRSPPPPG